MADKIRERFKENFLLGMILIAISLFSNFFLVKWTLLDSAKGYEEKRFVHLLRAMDHLFTALDHSQKSFDGIIKRDQKFLKKELDLARKELMDNRLRSLRVKAQGL
jgi:hypothetical protein